jgi:proteic killer suppression protein
MAFVVRFKETSLERIEKDAKFDGGYGEAVARAFRRRMQMIRSATDERDLREMKSVRFEKVKGDRSHQHSMRLNDQWRLIVELEGEGQGKTIIIVGIEDYH